MAIAKNPGEHPDIDASPEPQLQPIDFLEARRSRRVAALTAAEGLWKNRTDVPRDGIEYQNRLRAEWN
jgi:hypothetical protein